MWVLRISAENTMVQMLRRHQLSFRKAPPGLHMTNKATWNNCSNDVNMAFIHNIQFQTQISPNFRSVLIQAHC